MYVCRTIQLILPGLYRSLELDYYFINKHICTNMYFDNMSLVYNWQMVGHSSCVCSNIDMKAARYIRPNHLQLNAWYCQTFREMQVWICSLLPNHIQPKLKPERCKTPDSSVVVICTNIYYSSIWHQAKNQMIRPIARTVQSVRR